MNGAKAWIVWKAWIYGLVLVGALGVLLAWLIALIFAGGGDPNLVLSGGFSPASIKHGQYLARMGDCIACHTDTGGQPFAGGLAMQTPMGRIFSTNITPDRQTGIGEYTYGQFERAVRRGVARSGETLYPAMPYPSYAKISDDDMKDLYAYFMQAVTPVRKQNRRSDIPWPLSLRWPLTYWRWFFAPAVNSYVLAPADDPLSRGAYIVETLGHCGACHTPRGFAMQEKAMSHQDGALYLSGADIDHWVAPSLRNDEKSGLGSMSMTEIATLLKTGRNDRSAIFGGMSDVVHNSLQYLSDNDLAATAQYLKSLGSNDNASALAYDDTEAKAMYRGDVSVPGARLYVDHCATCHRTHGYGYPQTFPALALNPVVNGDDPTSLIHIVLRGGTMPGTRDTPTQYAMPAFGDRLSDEEVASLLTFVRSSWGNKASKVTSSEVRRLRKEIPESGPVMTDYDPRHNVSTR